MKCCSWGSWFVVGLAVVVGLALGGCGGSSEESSEPTERSSSSSGSEERAEPSDGIMVSGLMGTIRSDQVENALNPRMPRFTRCFADRMGTIELLAGDIRMSFRISTDGQVLWVYPSESTVGDRDTERCILDVARGTRFPRPNGGEAEFSWGFGLDADGPRPATSWSSTDLGTRESEVRAVGRECRARGSHRITAYIMPAGSVLAAGGTMPDPEGEGALDCILDRVRSMTMPDPGSWPAKVTFDVP
ncbi:MAG: AgmX/PglI C-terminal domain-containing protein [Sandaracinaceae bacterium]